MLSSPFPTVATTFPFKTDTNQIKPFLDHHPKRKRFKCNGSVRASKLKGPLSRNHSIPITTIPRNHAKSKITPVIVDPGTDATTTVALTKDIKLSKSTKSTTFKVTNKEKIDPSSFLYLIRLDLTGKYNCSPPPKHSSGTIEWPCLVLPDFGQGKLYHKRLYPMQHELQQRLTHECNKVTTIRNEHKGQVTILPLGDGLGCCPIEVCKRKNWPLFGVLDDSDSSAITIKKGGKRKFTPLLDDNVFYLSKKLRKKNLSHIPAFKNALMETYRLLSFGIDSETNGNADVFGVGTGAKRQRTFNTQEETHKQAQLTNTVRQVVPQSAVRATDVVMKKKVYESTKFIPRKSVKPRVASISHTAELNDRARTTSNNKMKNNFPRNEISKRKRAPVNFLALNKNTNKNNPKKKGLVPTTDPIIVPSWAEVNPLLQKLGHNFYNSDEFFFCRPNGDPRENKNAVNGKDYFTGNNYEKSLRKYRAYLCAHGVDCVRTIPNAEDGGIISTWVRFSILKIFESKGHEEQKFVTKIELGRKSPLKILQKIGYKYRTCNLDNGYLLLGAKEKTYVSECNLWEHLGKYGISNNCTFDSEIEQTAIELHVINKFLDKHGDKIFTLADVITKDELVNIEQHDHISTRKNSPIDKSSAFSSSPSQLLNEAFAKRIVSSKSQSDIQHDSITNNDEVEENHKKVKSITKQANKIDHSRYEHDKLSGMNSEQHTGKRRKNSNSESSYESSIEEVDLPGSTNKEKLLACIDYLGKNKLVASGQLSTSMSRIKNFVDTVIDSKGKVGDESNNFPILYVCGAPGTGKTMSIKQICEETIATKYKNTKRRRNTPRYCYLNCFNCREGGIEKFLRRMGTTEASLKRSKNENNNSATILILDEVDQFIGKKSTEAVLSELFKWAKSKNYMLSIIGISNAINNKKTTYLQERYGLGVPSNKYVFNTYRKEDLVKITQSRIGFSVVDKKAHELIAAKVANSCGDARKYLDLVSKAVQNCFFKLSPVKGDLVHTKPVVMIRDAMLAVRETNHKSKEVIESLTSLEKMTLCAGVHLSRKLDGKVTTLGRLRQLTLDAFDMDADVSLEDFKGIIERLQDSGLLKLLRGRSNDSVSSLINCPVLFDMQLEDVDSALEDTVLKEDFYRRMVERVNALNF